MHYQGLSSPDRALSGREATNNGTYLIEDGVNVEAGSEQNLYRRHVLEDYGEFRTRGADAAPDTVDTTVHTTKRSES